jgi:hypothetical protein
MSRRCVQENRELPDHYHTVLRHISNTGAYCHVAAPGWEYKILQKDFICKFVQMKLPIEKDTQLKQSNA